MIWLDYLVIRFLFIGKMKLYLLNKTKLFLFDFFSDIKHLMTGHKGNSEFWFPETLNVPRGEAEGEHWGRGETKLTVSRGASH